MSKSLISSCGSSFCFNNQMYQRALWLAQEYGWEPEKEAEHYLLNGGQEISNKESHGIALAIRAALDDIPNEDQQGDTGKDDDDLNMLEYWSGELKELIKQFAGFCEAGSFRVY